LLLKPRAADRGALNFARNAGRAGPPLGGEAASFQASSGDLRATRNANPPAPPNSGSLGE